MSYYNHAFECDPDMRHIVTSYRARASKAQQPRICDFFAAVSSPHLQNSNRYTFFWDSDEMICFMSMDCYLLSIVVSR